MIHVKKSKVWINFLNFSFSVCWGRKDEVKGGGVEEARKVWRERGGRGSGGEESRGERGTLPLGWVPALGLRWRQVERSGRCGGRVWCHLEPSACGLGNTWSANSPSAKPSERRLLLSRAVFIRYLSRTKICFVRERKKQQLLERFAVRSLSFTASNRT